MLVNIWSVVVMLVKIWNVVVMLVNIWSVVVMLLNIWSVVSLWLRHGHSPVALLAVDGYDSRKEVCVKAFPHRTLISAGKTASDKCYLC